MRKLMTATVTVIALVPLLAATFAPASARALSHRDLVNIPEAAKIYPSVKGGIRYKGTYGISAPRSAIVGGQLKCDRYKAFRAASRRTSYIYPHRDPGTPPSARRLAASVR